MVKSLTGFTTRSLYMALRQAAAYAGRRLPTGPWRPHATSGGGGDGAGARRVRAGVQAAPAESGRKQRAGGGRQSPAPPARLSALAESLPVRDLVQRRPGPPARSSALEVSRGVPDVLSDGWRPQPSPRGAAGAGRAQPGSPAPRP